MRWRTLGLALAMSGLVTAMAAAQMAQNGGLVPTGKGWGVPAPDPTPDLEKRHGHKPPPPPPPPPPANNDIDYHNGPVMTGTINAYFIWYGNWGGDTAVDILTDEIENIGGTPWFNINSTYYSGSGRTVKYVGNSVAYKGATTDDYSHGKSLSDDDVFGIVTDAITSGRLPKDANAVYFVLTSPDVDETSGFCGAYCGWHTYGRLGTTDIKFAFIGGAARCPETCTRTRLRSPNDNAGADGMASILAHELSESATDPLLNGWYSKDGEENADKCAWVFGNVYVAPNGASANVQWGPRDFLVQENWVNANGGACVQSYP